MYLLCASPAEQAAGARAAVTIALLCLGYLGYHTVHGDRGLQAWIGLSDRLSTR